MTLALATQYGITQTAMDFVRWYAELGDLKAAAMRSGVSETLCYNLVRQPQVQAAVHAEVRRKLTLSAPVALHALLDLAQHSKSDRVRADCAYKLITLAGHVVPRAAAPGQGIEKTLNEMSIEDLKDLAGKLEDELAGRAKPLNAPQDAAGSAQVSDLLG